MFVCYVLHTTSVNDLGGKLVFLLYTHIFINFAVCTSYVIMLLHVCLLVCTAVCNVSNDCVHIPRASLGCPHLSVC